MCPELLALTSVLFTSLVCDNVPVLSRRTNRTNLHFLFIFCWCGAFFPFFLGGGGGVFRFFLFVFFSPPF